MSDERHVGMVRMIAPTEGQPLLGGFALTKLGGDATANAFAVVEHTLPPRMLAAPLHTHHAVDELSYVLEGEIGALIGAQEIQAGPGTLVLKPKGVPHTFWNAGATPARLLAFIVPAGLERYFAELDQLLSAPGDRPDPAEITRLAEQYEMEMDFGSIPGLLARYGLTLGR